VAALAQLAHRARDPRGSRVWVPHDLALEPCRIRIVAPRGRLAVVQVKCHRGEPGGRHPVGHVADVRDHPIPLMENDHRTGPAAREVAPDASEADSLSHGPFVTRRLSLLAGHQDACFIW